ncbi:MAG: Hypothetical protein in Cyanoglobin locus, partial [uncultured Acetobacteraceae bacterium]
GAVPARRLGRVGRFREPGAGRGRGGRVGARAAPVLPGRRAPPGDHRCDQLGGRGRRRSGAVGAHHRARLARRGGRQRPRDRRAVAGLLPVGHRHRRRHRRPRRTVLPAPVVRHRQGRRPARPRPRLHLRAGRVRREAALVRRRGGGPGPAVAAGFGRPATQALGQRRRGAGGGGAGRFRHRLLHRRHETPARRRPAPERHGALHPRQPVRPARPRRGPRGRLPGAVRGLGGLAPVAEVRRRRRIPHPARQPAFRAGEPRLRPLRRVVRQPAPFGRPGLCRPGQDRRPGAAERRLPLAPGGVL